MCLRLKKPTIIIEYKENLEKGSLFLYITFRETLWINNIKLITIILLAFTIPFSGYGQLEYPLSSGCYPRPTLFFLSLSGGLNYSKINIDKVSTEYLPSGQIAIEFQSFLSTYKTERSTLLYGVSYELKKYNVLNKSSQNIQLNSSYLTIPIKYQYYFINLQKSIPLSVLLGGFYSFKLDENSLDKDNEYTLNSNYGIIVGAKLEYSLDNGYFLNLDYNFQYGFASIENTVASSGNISHLINFGFKFPSTIF